MLDLGISPSSSISLLPIPLDLGAVDQKKETEENILNAH